MKRIFNMSLSLDFKVLCYYAAFVTVVLATTGKGIENQLGIPAFEFERHAIVWPSVYHGRTKREINSTRDTAGDHHRQVTVMINVEGTEYLLDLQLNEMMNNLVISYQKNGEKVLHKPTKQELDICQYGGTVRGKSGSWVAVSTCRGISGVIYDGNTTKYIEPAAGNGIDALHFIYDRSDLNMTYFQGYKNTAMRYQQLQKNHRSDRSRVLPGINRYKRQADSTDSEKLYLELVLVADNEEFKANNESVEKVVETFKDLTNIVNSLYAPFNIVVALVGVDVWSEKDEILFDEDMKQTLHNFAVYKIQNLPNIPNDFTYLLTHGHFTEGSLGRGYIDCICDARCSTGVGKCFSQVKGMTASILAHEIGHNLGLSHNENNCTCVDNNCIMNAEFDPFDIPAKSWSNCTYTTFYRLHSTGRFHCLRNKPKTICKNRNIVRRVGGVCRRDVDATTEALPPV